MSRVNLSGTVVPSNYDLFLTINNDFFTGVAKILCTAIKKITSFEINIAKNLEIEEIKVKASNSTYNCNFKYLEEKEKSEDFVIITMKDKKEINSNEKFTLEIKYKSKGYGNLDGFYKKTDANGNFLFSTQFEPTDARKAFPCFDQPDLKATFNVKINCESKYMALGNGGIKNITEENDRKTFTFEETPKMSTYIVAWVVGQLKARELKKEGIVVRVFATEEELEWAEYSLEVAYNCLKYFEKYFGIKYPLSKADLVSIPSFASGAMENWGLITFRKTSLLFSKDNSFIRSKKIIANTVCHELAHMWFGNLVTMRWWNDLWLNEGFATWAASKALYNLSKDHSHLVDWNEVTNFASSDIEGGMTADCLENTHKIAVEVKNPGEIDQIFDAISYDKGSSVIKMLENWMGEVTFQKGIKSYLKKYEYNNAETVDLWEELDKARDNNEIKIKDLMDSWVSRDGFPMVSVMEHKDKLILTQKRFTKGYEKLDSPWPIPLSIKWYNTNNTTNSNSSNLNNSNEKVEKILFDKTEMIIPKLGDIYKLNHGMCSFVRVEYPKENFERLLSEKYNDLDKVDVLNLVADFFEFSLALKGSFDYTQIINIVEKETNYEVIESVLMNLNFLTNAFYDDANISNYFKSMQNKIIKKRLKNINLSKEANKEKTVNDLCIDSLAVTIGVQNGIFKVDNKDVHQEFRKNYFVSLVDKNFDKTVEFYKTSILPGVTEAALMALGKTKELINLKKLINKNEMPFTEFVKKHDIHYFAYSLGTNETFRDTFAEFVMDNFDEFEKFIGDTGMFRSVISSAFSNIYTEKVQKKVLEFLNNLLKNNEVKNKYERVILKVKDNLNSTNLLRSKVREFYNKLHSI